MKPYRNKGWRWLNKFESILPIAGARGKNAFTATSVAAPPLTDREEGEEGSMSVGIGNRHGSEVIETSSTIAPAAVAGCESDQMDVDTAVGSSSIGKRKHSDSLTENNESLTTTTSVSSVFTAPPKKKASSRGSQVVSKTSSASGGTSAKAAAKITPAVAIHNMQGSINRLTDIMEKTLAAPDPASVQRTQAMELLQKQDDGLTMEEQSEMISKFVMDSAIAGAYISLKDNAGLRQNWLQHLLKQNQD
jgi:hypothetical protein